MLRTFPAKRCKNIDGQLITGYELHEGVTNINNAKPLFKIEKGYGNNTSKSNSKESYDGAINGMTFGTYLHGIFHNFNFRRAFTDYLRIMKGLKPLGCGEDPFEKSKQYSIDRLAQIVEENIDMDFINHLIEDKNEK